jgi:hypothetical protein
MRLTDRRLAEEAKHCGEARRSIPVAMVRAVMASSEQHLRDETNRNRD